MKRIGVFLGMPPTIGGLFVYTRSVLDALRLAHSSGYEVEVAFVGTPWERVLSGYPFGRRRMLGGVFGLWLSKAIMYARIPGSWARIISLLLNPIAWQLKGLACNVWLFPAQDTLTYQLRLCAIGTVHDLMHRYEPDFPEVSVNARSAARDHRFSNLTAWSNLILVDSELGKEHVIESYGVSRSKVLVLPYVTPWYILEREPDGFDERYKLPDKFLFYPARFLEHKNHKGLIRAVFELQNRVSDLAVVFTENRGGNFGEVFELARSLGLADRITYVGYITPEDLGGFYRRARCMIMPSFFGPTNLPPLEAFAAGCPAAISNVYAMADQANGAALLFNPRSVVEIANAIERLWTDDRLCESLVKRGRQNHENWNQVQFSHRLLEILRSTGRL